MNWAKEQIAYDYVKTRALSQLALVEEIISQPVMPEIKIAGPRGDIITLPEKDKFTLVTLWSAKCGSCVMNLNTLKRLKYILDGYKEDWKIIGVSVDSPDDLEKVTKLIKKYKLTEIAEYYDANRSLIKYIRPKTLPITLIINDKGHILYKVYGTPPWLNADVISFLRAMNNGKK
jgi:peroxiredoxin